MIIVNAEKINPFFIENEEKINKYIEEYENKLNNGYLKCPYCNSSDLIKWGNYERNIIYLINNESHYIVISVTSTYATKALETLEDTILGLDIQEEDSGATGLYQVEHTGANIEFTTETTKVQNLQKMEYRFAGKDPNNYVSFGETYKEDSYEAMICRYGSCYNATANVSNDIKYSYSSEEECNSKLGIVDVYIRSLGSGSMGVTSKCEQTAKMGEPILWRVIGIVNTPEGQRVKIIENKVIGYYSWDTSASGVNDGDGVNEWSKSDLMKLLNPNFDEEDVNNSLYWNGTSGDCYVDENEQTKPCDFSGRGILEELKGMIEEVTWNIGANGDEAYIYEDYNTSYNIPIAKMYEYERSKNNGKQLCEREGGTRCNDEEARTYTWRGKVGLMYPSDYGYAASGGDDYSRSQCLIQSLYNWVDNVNCYENDWLLASGCDWTLAPASNSGRASLVFYTMLGDFVRDGVAEIANGVHPSVYLTSNVFVLDGEGTKENPWILGVE